MRLRQRQSGYELQTDPDLIGRSMASGCRRIARPAAARWRL